MTDAKKHEQNGSGDGIATESGREIPDERLEGVAGGAGDAPRCPLCGSTNYFYDGANRTMICGDCMVGPLDAS